LLPVGHNPRALTNLATSAASGIPDAFIVSRELSRSFRSFLRSIPARDSCFGDEEKSLFTSGASAFRGTSFAQRKERLAIHSSREYKKVRIKIEESDQSKISLVSALA
jgi:hypothetical protein